MPQALPKIGDEVLPLPPVGGEVGQAPTFRVENAKDANGHAVVNGLSSAWSMANTPLVPQIADAAHAIANHIDAPKQDRSKTIAQIRGFLAGATQGTGDLLAGFTSPVGIALTLAGLGPESRLAEMAPAFKRLLSLPEIKVLQRAVQTGSGAAFGAHGAAQVVTAPTLGEKAQGVVEMATGALGVRQGVAGASVRVPPVARNQNPVEAAAVEFGQQRGVPVDAGTASGNMFVKGAQAGADRTPLGAIVAARARQAQGMEMQRVGGELADHARGGAVTPEQAGANVGTMLEGKIQAHAQYADHAYDTVTTLANDPKFTKTVTLRTEQVPTGVLDAHGQMVMRATPVTESMQLPVDLRASKAALKPIFSQLTRQYSVTQQQASAGFKALGNIVNGPDFAPFLQVERDLGAVKSIARGAEMPELRNQSQGLAASGVRKLQSAVDQTAQGASPEVWRALQDGRAATVEKFATADVLERVRNEPVGAYRQATAPQDSGIEFLRTVAKQTPQAIPQLARAWLDDALAKATAKGGFEKGAKLDAGWDALGAETRKILFPQKGQIEALNNYFLLARKLADNVNPSGTALTGVSVASGGLLFADPVTGVSVLVGAGALSKILRNPRAVQLLTKGMTLTVGPGQRSALAHATAVTNITHALRVAGVPQMMPLGADQSTSESAGQR